MREREYYRAITEYRRFLFTFPRDSWRSMAHIRVGLSFLSEVAKWLWQGECLMRQGKLRQRKTFTMLSGNTHLGRRSENMLLTGMLGHCYGNKNGKRPRNSFEASPSIIHFARQPNK